MDANRWARVKSLFEAAIARPEHERAVFLKLATADDSSLCQQVESLLAANAKAGDFSADWRSRISEAITTCLISPAERVGRTIGHYHVQEVRGFGGMGVVYRAYDTRLQRPVALKIVNTNLVEASARAALLREARNASALNHPHVCTVYEIGDFDGEPYIAMEWIDGESLDSVVARGAVPVADVLRYGIQIADALAHAHERGVVHRDLKSANIALTRDGRVKLLDFGVARRLDRAALERATRSEAALDAPQAGTLRYMPPEVLRGNSSDERSDIWAVGVVLQELLSGTVPFDGQTAFELTSAILRDPPPSLPAAVPSSVRDIVARCLMKDPRERYRRAADIKGDLEAAAPKQTGIRREDVSGPNNRSRKSAEDQARPSIAVVYFENLSGGGEQEYLRDGMTEDVITELCKVSRLRVFPRSAVMSYRDKPVTAAEVGRDLKASYVLAGSVRHAGHRVRITAQLIETSGGHTVWAERFDRELQDVFDLQDEIARSIAQALRIKLSPQEESAIAGKAVADPEAYDAYLRGRRLVRRGTKKDMESAVKLFEHAVAVDSNFALAYAALGHVYGRIHRYYDRNPQLMERGVEACERALKLEPELPEALSARALLYHAHGQYDLAIQYARMALQRKPDCEGAYATLGNALYYTDRLDEVVALVDRAIESSGDDYNVYLPYINVLKKLDRQDEEQRWRQQHIRVLEWQIEWAPDNVRARILLACCYANVGRTDDALVHLEKAIADSPNDASTLFNAACAYAVLGLKKEALSTLKGAVQNGFWHLDVIARDPDFTSLHDEPEFQLLLQTRHA
jgi:serine/threonine protein kinase/tetratricopeptide (TPR) repeat protein